VLIETKEVSPSSQAIGDFIQKKTQYMDNIVYVPIEVYGPKVHDLSLTLDGNPSPDYSSPTPYVLQELSSPPPLSSSYAL